MSNRLNFVKQLDSREVSTITNYTESKLVDEQPKHITLPLKLHQRATIHQCILRETHNAEIKNEGETFKCNIGILGDKVGTGKSLTVLGLISQKHIVQPNQYVHTHMDTDDRNSLYQYTNISTVKKNYATNCDVLIIPHNVLNQWKTYIDTQTTGLNIFYYNTRTKKEINLEKINGLDLIIVTSTHIQDFNKYLYGREIEFNRVFIDEVDSIKNVKRLPYGRFYWCITASFINLMYPNRSYVSSLKGCRGLVRSSGTLYNLFSYISKRNDGLYKKIWKYILLTNDDQVINNGIQLPSYRVKIHRCMTHILNDCLQDLLPSKIQEMIDADNIEGVVDTLNCTKVKVNGVIDLLTKPEQLKIDTLHKTLREVEFKEYADKDRKEARITQLNDEIKQIQAKIENIKTRLETNTICGICMSEPKGKSITPCCNQTFCISCINQWLHTTKICPFCRQTLISSDLIVPIEHTEKTKKREYPTKLDKTIDIVTNSKRKTLIFSMHDNTMNTLLNKFKEHNIRYGILKGTMATIRKTIRLFDKGIIKVLFMNAKYFGAGLNLQMATDVVLYHYMDKGLQEQCIGRAQRMGRTTSLRVWKLYNEQEIEKEQSVIDLTTN
mgnify:CR=1 FL=1